MVTIIEFRMKLSPVKGKPEMRRISRRNNLKQFSSLKKLNAYYDCALMGQTDSSSAPSELHCAP